MKSWRGYIFTAYTISKDENDLFYETLIHSIGPTCSHLARFCASRSRKFSKQKCVSIDSKCSETHRNAKVTDNRKWSHRKTVTIKWITISVWIYTFLKSEFFFLIRNKFWFRFKKVKARTQHLVHAHARTLLITKVQYSCGCARDFNPRDPHLHTNGTSRKTLTETWNKDVPSEVFFINHSLRFTKKLIDRVPFC